MPPVQCAETHLLETTASDIPAPTNTLHDLLPTEVESLLASCASRSRGLLEIDLNCAETPSTPTPKSIATPTSRPDHTVCSFPAETVKSQSPLSEIEVPSHRSNRGFHLYRVALSCETEASQVRMDSLANQTSQPPVFTAATEMGKPFPTSTWTPARAPTMKWSLQASEETQKRALQDSRLQGLSPPTSP